MDDRVEMIGEETLAKNWGTLKRARFKLKRRDGTWQVQVRETYDHGHGAGILLCNRKAGTVLLIRQFRYPVYANNDPAWLIEICAGLLDDDDPQTCAVREAEEETGHRVKDVRFACAAYLSPGSFTEKLSIFVGDYDDTTRVSRGGGLEGEGEDIELIELPFEAALAMIESGAICDAKTIMALQWAALNKVFAAGT